MLGKLQQKRDSNDESTEFVLPSINELLKFPLLVIFSKLLALIIFDYQMISPDFFTLIQFLLFR